MKFRVLARGSWAPDKGENTVYLRIDRWNDYSFVTMFQMLVHDEKGDFHEIGDIKIGFKGQTTEIDTCAKLPEIFESLDSEFFSLGQGTDFYRNAANLPNDMGKKILQSLRDIVTQPNLIEEIKDEEVFRTSLLRSVSLSVIKGQYARVLAGQVELTDFKFKFSRPEMDDMGGIELSFEVKVGAKPSTNIHGIIGRNGVGKTTILNGMIDAITNRQISKAKFLATHGWYESDISSDYFSSLVSVSFSAFDPFSPPKEQPDPTKGTCYFYIGLKDPSNGDIHRSIDDLQADCAKALINCFNDKKKTVRWLNAISKLGSDENFASMRLERLEEKYRERQIAATFHQQSAPNSLQDQYLQDISQYLSRMSSGHAVVLLTITRLVATVEEKTLILLDEPESHLHPPLLSAFIRALSDLLHDRNGVAIIATHSPVVLQEIPKCCVWKIYRVRSNVTASRPDIETFGENVGVLTTEVFSLEVERSGFHEILSSAARTGRSYEEILGDFNDQLGLEGRVILRTLIANRDRGIQHDATE